ncbi:MAG TPA: IPT/TIG domain-containing protein [Kofleriaceae bacterium]|nr:IPT/TIG domain-containing protein [Kofleriaceae bacterium]
MTVRGRRFAAAALVVAGCSGPTVTIASLDPPFGPLGGGSATTIHGDGFDAAAHAPEVLIGGRAAPVVIVQGHDRLTVLTPPAAAAGDVDVEVVMDDRVARIERGFRYSAAPVITGVTPGVVHLEVGNETVTVTGHGFLDEGAGPPTLLVDGLGVDATVERDDRLTFVAPIEWPLREPQLDLINTRGEAIAAHGFRWLPERPGLLVFTFDGTRFAVYIDPVSGRTMDLPFFTAEPPALAAAVREPDGTYVGLDFGSQLGVVDVSDQQLLVPVQAARRLTSIAGAGGDPVAYDEDHGQLGRVDVTTGAFTLLPSWPAAPGACALAFVGERLHACCSDFDTGAVTIREVDPSTGAAGLPVAVAAELGPIRTMTSLGGTLYAIDGKSQLVTIDPATGASAIVPVGQLFAEAMTTYE